MASTTQSIQKTIALRWGVVVLAAGQGTRMHSNLPKVLHRVAGKCLIDHVLDQARTAVIPSDMTVVVGHGGNKGFYCRASAGMAKCLRAGQAKRIGRGP